MKSIRDCDEVEERDETTDILGEVNLARRDSEPPLRSKTREENLAKGDSELSLKHKIKEVNLARSDSEFQMKTKRNSNMRSHTEYLSTLCSHMVPSKTPYPQDSGPSLVATSSPKINEASLRIIPTRTCRENSWLISALLLMSMILACLLKTLTNASRS